jgi:hypothetical protein
MRIDFEAFDWRAVELSPLLISCRTALIATAITFFLGVWQRGRFAMRAQG